MSTKELAKAFARALAQSEMPQSEKEEWALFSALMTEKQVREFIALLSTQNEENMKALEELKDQIS